VARARRVTVTPPVFQNLVRSGNSIILNWSAVAGQTNQLQYKTNLNQPDWLNLGTCPSPPMQEHFQPPTPSPRSPAFLSGDGGAVTAKQDENQTEPDLPLVAGSIAADATRRGAARSFTFTTNNGANHHHGPTLARVVQCHP